MTWFQLVEAQQSDPEPQQPAQSSRLAPNSALFFNPCLPLEAAAEPRSRASRPRLRLVKGASVDPAVVLTAA